MLLSNDPERRLRPEALDAVLEAAAFAGNPSSLHRAGQAARRRVDEARAAVRELVGATPAARVVFTGGGGEAVRLGQRARRGAQAACAVAAPGGEPPGGRVPVRVWQPMSRAPRAPGAPEPPAEVVVVSASALGGPDGVAALVLEPGIEVTPLWQGGGQEEGLRSGTPAVALIAGFGAAARAALAEASMLSGATRREAG